MPNTNVQKSLYCQSLKFILENARRQNEYYDITEYPYSNPLHLIVKHQQFLSDENLREMQQVNELYLKLQRTQKSPNLSALLNDLYANRKWYKYLLTFFKFVVGCFPSPFSLLVLDLLRPGNTYSKWISVNNQGNFHVRNGDDKYMISFPRFAAPAAVYRILQSASSLSQAYNLLNYCYQSHSQLSNSLVAYHLLSNLKD